MMNLLILFQTKISVQIIVFEFYSLIFPVISLFYFPGKEFSQFAHIAFTTEDDSNLFTAENIRQMCRIEDQIIRTHSSFSEICLTKSSNECCPSWSLGNYISNLSHKSNCSLITENDVKNVYDTLHKLTGSMTQCVCINLQY
jgi:hypothetical protein